MAWEVRLLEGFHEYVLVTHRSALAGSYASMRHVDGARAREIVRSWAKRDQSAIQRLRELVVTAPHARLPRHLPRNGGDAQVLSAVLERLADPGPAGLRLLTRPRPLFLPTPGTILEPPAPPYEPEPEEELEFIYVRLVDAQGNPRANEAYEVTLPDGSIRSGRLDDGGNARIEGIPPGRCLWRFPDLHPDEWRA